RPVRFEDAVEQLAEIADESVIPPPPSEEEIQAAGYGASQSATESFPVERITDDELPTEAGERAAVEAAPQPTEAEAVEPETKPKRGRGRKAAEPKKKPARAEDKPVKSTTRKTTAKAGSSRARRDELAKIEDVGSQFERVTDEDIAQDAGELLKDALVQEKIFEAIHTAEFETPTFQPEPEP